MSNDGDKAWTAQNAKLIYSSLVQINTALGGSLGSVVGDLGITFKMMDLQDGGEYEYLGETHGTNVDFFSKGDAALRQQNILHEFGHVLDNLPGKRDVFSDRLVQKNATQPSWLDANCYINPAALNNVRVADPNYTNGAGALQHPSDSATEQWADIFANHVAGNIDYQGDNTMGQDMHNWIVDALAVNFVSR